MLDYTEKRRCGLQETRIEFHNDDALVATLKMGCWPCLVRCIKSTLRFDYCINSVGLALRPPQPLQKPPLSERITMSTPSLVADDLMVHDPGRNLLFCCLCKTGVNPGWDAIRRHFGRQHPRITAPEKQLLRQAFADVEAVSSAGTRRDASEEDQAAIRAIEDRGYCEYLRDPVPGFRCTVVPDCRHCTTTRRSMMEHITGIHRGNQVFCRPISVQSLFTGPGMQFFEVKPPIEEALQSTQISSDETEVWATYQASLAAHQRRLAIAAKLEDAQSNMFEERMGWAALLRGQDMSDLARQADPESLEEDAGIDAQEIWSATELVVHNCHVALKHTDHVTRRYLFSVNDRISETPLKPVRTPKTVRRYAAHWARFVLLTCRIARWSADEKTERGIEFSGIVQTSIDDVLEVFTIYDTPEKRVDPLEHAIFGLSRVILGQQMGARHTESPLLYYLAVDGWELLEQRWKVPVEHSGALSALVYILRTIAARELQDCRNMMHLNAEGDFDMVRRYHSSRLISGCGTVFDEIFNRRSFTMEIAANWYSNPKVQWSEHRDALCYDGDTIRIADMRRLMQGLLTAAEEWLCNLLGVRIEYLAKYNPGPLREDFAWANAGGSIVDLNECLRGGVEQMNERGQKRGTYWSKIWTRSRLDRIMGKHWSCRYRGHARD